MTNTRPATDTEVAREQSGNTILILIRLAEPRRRWNKGHLCHYRLITHWLADRDDPSSIMGRNVTYWTDTEGGQMLKTGLFANAELF